MRENNNLVGEGVAGAEAESALGPLGDLSQDHTKVGDGVLDRLLQLLQVTAGVLDSGQGHEQTEDVVGALEDSEDPEVTHNLLEAEGLHVAVASQHLPYMKNVSVVSNVLLLTMTIVASDHVGLRNIGTRVIGLQGVLL